MRFIFLIAVFLMLAPVSSLAGKLNYMVTPRQSAPPQDTSAQRDNTTTQHNKGSSPASRVWDKYQKLAGDKPKPTASTSSASASAASKQKLVAEKTAAQSPKTTGFEALLQNYQANKQNKSQMHSLTIQRPAPPSKPEVQKP